MILRKTFHIAPEQGPEQGQERIGYLPIFSGPETVSGGVFRMYFNGFQVFSPGPRHRQCEWFLHNIGPYPCPGPGDSQCEYTISDRN